MHSAVKYTLIYFVQVWVVFDSKTIQIYKGRLSIYLTQLNSTEDKSDWTFEEKIVDYGYELRWKVLFSVKNWEVSKYLETFSNFSIERQELPLFKEEDHQKTKLVKFFNTKKIDSWIFLFLFQTVFLDIVTHNG